MSNKRTVLVREISYRGADGEDHVAHEGDEITVHPDGVAVFDMVHDATPEAQWAKLVGVGKTKPAPASAPAKAVEKA